MRGRAIEMMAGYRHIMRQAPVVIAGRLRPPHPCPHGRRPQHSPAAVLVRGSEHT